MTNALKVLDGLNEKQKLAAAALADGSTRDKAAEIAGVDRTTVFRWLRNPDFVTAYKSLAQSTLESLIGKAVNTLESMLSSDNEWVRMNAAKTIIDRVMPTIEAQNSAIHIEFNMPKPAMPDPIVVENGELE